MKYRIVSRRDYYVIQYKFLFWWLDVQCIGGGEKRFNTADEAKADLAIFNKSDAVVFEC